MRIIDHWQAAGEGSPWLLLALLAVAHPATHLLISALFVQRVFCFSLVILPIFSAVTVSPLRWVEQVHLPPACQQRRAAPACVPGTDARRDACPTSQLWGGSGVCARLAQVPGMDGPLRELYALLQDVHTR